jgi:hypothetical protein
MQKKEMKQWSSEEKQSLIEWLESGWDFHFPGYEQAALHINFMYGNSRTASACRAMDKRLFNQPTPGAKKERMKSKFEILNKYSFDISGGYGDECPVLKYDGASEAMDEYTEHLRTELAAVKMERDEAIKVAQAYRLKLDETLNKKLRTRQTPLTP